MDFFSVIIKTLSIISVRLINTIFYSLIDNVDKKVFDFVFGGHDLRVINSFKHNFVFLDVFRKIEYLNNIC